MNGIPTELALRPHWQPASHMTFDCRGPDRSGGEQRSFPGQYPARADQVSGMAKQQSLSTRSRAVGMVSGGMTHGQVAEALGVSRRTICRWLSRDRGGQTLENKTGRGRKSSVSRVAKIVMAKSVLRRGQSTRKLARRLTASGHPISKSTVHRYLRTSLKLKPIRPRLQPKLTELQKRKRLEFAMARRNWTVDDWRRVLFTDESPFELYHPPNRQNDRVWAHCSSEVPPTETVKQPLKIMVWGMMSYRGLSDLHIIPRGQTVTANYYVEEILSKTATSAMTRKENKGPPTEAKLLPNMSRAIFQQDGAPAHRARKAQEWCRSHFPAFWEKDEWPGNSPDLSPIENLWAIVQEEINKMAPATSEGTLARNVRAAWSKISSETLDNLMSGMPDRMLACIREKGGYICK